LVVENIEVTVVVVVAVAILDIATDFRIIVVIADWLAVFVSVRIAESVS